MTDIRPQNTINTALLFGNPSAQNRDAQTNSTERLRRPQQAFSRQDLVSIPSAGPNAQPNGARLLNETRENIDNGTRLTQNFETPDNRSFSRITTFSRTDSGLARDVIQQNPSGSIIRLEENLTEQPNGLFQRSLRFTDEIGNTTTRIENDVPPFRSLNANQNIPLPRGSQIDIQA